MPFANLEHKKQYEAARRARIKQDPELLQKLRAQKREQHRRYRERRTFRNYGKRKPEDPLKRHARRKNNWAIESGKITRQPCQVCGEPKSHGHHPDYSKPFEVVWLCPKHHGEQHRKAA